MAQATQGSAGHECWSNRRNAVEQLAHGIDDRRVVPDREAKSISHETTFAADIKDTEVLRAWLLELTDQVGRRLRRHGLCGRTVQIKVRFADFQTITRAGTLSEPSNVTDELWQAAGELLATKLPAGHLPLRLLGMGVSGFDAAGAQGLLFDQEERQKQRQLDDVADRIHERFGAGAFGRASGLRHHARHKPMPRPDG